MRYIDITKTMQSGMKRYPSDPEVRIRRFKSLSKGDSCNLCAIKLGSHAGTHIDAPRHVFRKGRGVDRINIGDLICNVAVTDFTTASKQGFIKQVRHIRFKGILFKRGRSQKRYLTLKDAIWLVKSGLRLVGTSELTIEDPLYKKHPVHRFLLRHGVVLVEGLDLERVKAGCYTLICLPLKLSGGDGAPARAVLIYD